MIMARNEDGTYSQVGFVKDNSGIDTEYIYDKDGDIVFEKGFTRETSGTVPLTINGIGKDLKDWSITGNTVQNGTPTPENPVEVQAVGDRTGNLFDNSLLEQGGWKATAGTIPTKLLPGETNYTNRTRYNQIIPLLASTLSLYCPANIKINYVWIDANGISLGGSGFQKNGDTATAPEQAVSMTFILGLDSDIECTPSDFSDINLVAGSIAPESYEPYGYKIPVVTRGKNLLEPIGFSAEIITNINDYRKKTNNYGTSLSTVYGGSVLVTQANQIDTTTSYVNGVFYIVVDFSKFTTGKNYILSFDYEIKEKHSVQGNSIAYIGNSTSPTKIYGDWGKDGRKSATFTVKEGFKPYIAIRLCGNSIFVSNIQIEEDLTATPYEPYHEPITTPIYLDSPLYKIGDYADRLSNTEEVRVVNELVLTGKELWRKDLAGDNIFYYTSNVIKTNDILCTHLPTLTNYPKIEVGIYRAINGALYVNFGTTINTVVGLEEYLAAQYAAGTPVKVYYVMQTPETKTVEPVEIPTINGTTVIDVDTAVKPTEMYTKYKSSK